MKMMIKTADIINSDLWKLFPAINVDKVKEIPCDYMGAMGVPITFLDKHDPERFEILGITDSSTRLENGRAPYRRLVIRNLKPELPDEIDLMGWLERCGIEVEVEIVD